MSRKRKRPAALPRRLRLKLLMPAMLQVESKLKQLKEAAAIRTAQSLSRIKRIRRSQSLMINT